MTSCIPYPDLSINYSLPCSPYHFHILSPVSRPIFPIPFLYPVSPNRVYPILYPQFCIACPVLSVLYPSLSLIPTNLYPMSRIYLFSPFLYPMLIPCILYPLSCTPSLCLFRFVFSILYPPILYPLPLSIPLYCIPPILWALSRYGIWEKGYKGLDYSGKGYGIRDMRYRMEDKG